VDSFINKIIFKNIEFINTLMKIPNKIDFSGLLVRKNFGKQTPEYKELDNINEGLDWRNYCNKMNAKGINVTFDVITESFVVMPNDLKKTLKEDNDRYDLDTEDANVFYEDDEDYQDEPDPIVSSPSPSMQVLSLDDLMKILGQTIGTPNVMSVAPVAAGVAEPPTAAADASVPGGTEVKAPPVPGTKLQGGPEALKAAFHQEDGNTLSSDFKELATEISSLESKTQPNNSYVKNIDGFNTEEFQQIGKDINAQIKELGIDGFEDDDEVDAPYDQPGMEPDENMKPLENTLGDVPNENGFAGDASGSIEDPADAEPTDYTDDFGDKDELDVEIEPTDVKDKGSKELLTDEDDSDDAEDEDDDLAEGLYDGDYFNTDEVNDDGEGYGEFFTDEINDDDEEPYNDSMSDYQEVPEMNINDKMKLGSNDIQITLKGVTITISELGYISETVQKAGNKLRSIIGEGTELKINVEANDKQYVIEYSDRPSNKTKTPFRINKYNFRTLEEALDRINYKREIKENKVFRNILNMDLATRNDDNYKASDIFEESAQINYVAGWNVKSVGVVNLKSGMNETYSNILQHSTEPNTLVITENKEYLLLKGNLKERSKLGTVKELIDPKGKKSYGISKVVGIYENTEKGLGNIMFRTKKTSIPLLVWK